jgi:hypothetical protein
MDMPINARAEGRVLVPWEHRQYSNTTQQTAGKCFDVNYLTLIILTF